MKKFIVLILISSVAIIATMAVAFSINAFAEDSPSLITNDDEYMLGDVNNDGLIDSIDASIILAEYARLSSQKPSGFTAVQTKSADIDNDGMVDSYDASRVLAYYAYVSSNHDGVVKSLEEFVGRK